MVDYNKIFDGISKGSDMSDLVYAKAQAQQKTLIGSSPKNSLLQRTCACGQHTIAGGECEECREKREGTLLRSQRAFGAPSAPVAVAGNSPAQENGLSFNSAFDRESRFGHDFSRIPIHPHAGAIQTKLAINKPGDEYKVADAPEEMRSDPISPPVAQALQFDFTRIPLTVPTIQRRPTVSSPGDLF